MIRAISILGCISLCAGATVCLAQKGNSPPVHALEVLQQGAADHDPDTRRQVALALSLSRAATPVIPLLESLVKDPDYMVRLAALDAIGELGEKKLSRLAEPALEDDVPEVMFAAARALHRLKDPAGKSMLLAIVEREEKAQSNPLRVSSETSFGELRHRGRLSFLR